MLKTVTVLFSIIFIGTAEIAYDFEEILQDELQDYEGSNEFISQEPILKKHRNGNKEWDALIFTQSWPPSDCIAWRQKPKKNKCRPLKPVEDEHWTIHGIWPTKWGTHGPVFCARSEEFNTSTINDLLTRMRRQWPTMGKSGNRNHFWRHEWDKHGACAAKLPELGSVRKYFLTALNWNTMFTLEEWLSSMGITPGKEYELIDIWEAVRHASGVDPQINCFNDNKTNKSYLLEIMLCFDKKLLMIDCKAENRKKSQNSYSLHDKIQSLTNNCLLTVVYPSAQNVQPNM